MYTHEEHLDNLLRHITLVRDACTLIGKRLIGQGYKGLGRLFIVRGHTHDVSKFTWIEWIEECLDLLLKDPFKR